MSLITHNAAVNTNFFEGITVYFHPEKFDSQKLGWGILFSRSGESESADRLLRGVTKGIDSETGYVKVEYSANGIENWSGVIKQLRFDLLSGSGSQYVKAVVFDYYDTVEVDNVTITGIQNPVPGIKDESEKTVKEASDSRSSFEKIEWYPALKDGRFEANTSYTATFSPTCSSPYFSKYAN